MPHPHLTETDGRAQSLVFLLAGKLGPIIIQEQLRLDTNKTAEEQFSKYLGRLVARGGLQPCNGSVSLLTKHDELTSL